MSPHDPQPATPGPLCERVEALEQVAAGHTEAIGALLDLLESAGPGGPWLWRDLEADQRDNLWAQLFEFVTWVHDRHLRQLGTDLAIAPCWFRHPVAVEHLTALMVAHHATYNARTPTPSTLLVEWHERCLWPVLGRLGALGVFKGCRRAHVEPTDRGELGGSDDFARFRATTPDPAQDPA